MNYIEGLEEVEERIAQVFTEIRVDKTEHALTEALIVGAGYAAAITPIDTSDMLNSQGREVVQNGDIWNAAVYYVSEYAKWVHEMPGTLKGRPRADFGTTGAGDSFGGGTGSGNYWGPNGEPEFLKKGMELMIQNDLEGIQQRHYRL
jgi:hypothetical protein